MKINGYELNVSEDFLDDIFAHKTRTIELVNKDFPGYRNLTEGNKKALEHLVAAAKIFDDVAMEQDHEKSAGRGRQNQYACRQGSPSVYVFSRCGGAQRHRSGAD